MNTFKESITNAVATTTNGTVVVGNMKGSPNDVGLISSSNFIVIGVDRDSDELEPSDGQILMAADSIKLDAGLDSILIGDKSLQQILSQSGQGEVNTIVTVKTNGVALVPDANRAIDIAIPSAGEGNVIESITTNGVALPINDKTVDIPLQDYVKLSDLQEGITFGTMTVSNLTINGKKPSLEGHVHDDKLDATNGVAFGDLKVYPMPSGIVGQTHTIITHESMSIGNVEYKEDGIVYNGETYGFNSDTNGVARMKDIPNISGLATKQEVSELTITTAKVTDLDSYKNPTISSAALTAIDGINNAQDIATIKSTLTNFLHQFVIQQP